MEAANGAAPQNCGHSSSESVRFRRNWHHVRAMRGGCPGFKGPVPQPVSMSLQEKPNGVQIEGQRTNRYMPALTAPRQGRLGDWKTTDPNRAHCPSRGKFIARRVDFEDHLLKDSDQRRFEASLRALNKSC